MTIRIKLFAILREKAGRSELTVEVPDDCTVQTAAEQLQCDYPVLQPYLARCAFAVNQSYVPATAVLHDNDELAIIPPVSGG